MVSIEYVSFSGIPNQVDLCLHTKFYIFLDHPSEELLNQLECKCCDCGKSFDSADQLNTHLQLVHLREVSLGCDRCNTKWASISALQKHIAEAHKIIVYPCEICGKTFKNRYTRVAHIKVTYQGVLTIKLLEKQNFDLFTYTIDP